MTTRVCKSKMDVEDCCKLLQSRKLPITVNIIQGNNKSHEQDNLENMWHREAVEQLQDETAEQKRGYCKLSYGIPIMLENDEYREIYNRFVRPLNYEQKIELMMVPIDWPVTRRMTTGQKKRYLDDVYDYYTSLGVQLTQPDEQ